jgi:hypothetical protein
MDDRNRLIATGVLKYNQSMASVGKQFGISAVRTRQIVNKFCMKSNRRLYMTVRTQQDTCSLDFMRRNCNGFLWVRR